MGLHFWAYKAIPLPQRGASPQLRPYDGRLSGAEVRALDLIAHPLGVKGHCTLNVTSGWGWRSSHRLEKTLHKFYSPKLQPSQCLNSNPSLTMESGKEPFPPLSPRFLIWKNRIMAISQVAMRLK